MIQRTLRIVMAAALASIAAQASAAASTIVRGDARFTIVTPNLIRIESAPGGTFTDAPTMFAADRAARFDGATIREGDGSLTIDTGAITLRYQADGKPLGPTNLSASVRGGASDWHPGAADPLNLGGTLRTLDQIKGPVDLGRGLLSRSGWAVIDDSKTPIVTVDWATTRPAPAGATDWYFFGYGHDYRAALKSLAAIGGPVPMPRRNLLGIWYSRYWPYSSDEYRQIVKQYDDHGFPLDNIVMDMDWHVIEVPGNDNHMIWTGYTVNAKLLPDFAELLKWFHGEGLFVTLNDHPSDGVQPHESMYAGFMRAMHADPTSKKTLPFDAGDRHYMDTFWAFTHAPLEKLGVDFWWLDWQQYPFTKSIGDLTNLAWLNKLYFDKTTADGRRGVSFSRWAGWGDHRYPIHFSGDADTGWPMLAFEVPFTATSGNVGCFFWTHDIGGHMGGRNEESYARWCQFGALSAALRSHSTRDPQTDRRPWMYPDWAERSMKASFRLRAQLMPYVYTSVAESSAQTIPLVRPLYFDEPEQEPAYHHAQEYRFGDALLVAPITTPGVGPSRLAWQSVWFPAGRWYDYFTGERHDGGSEAIVACDIDTFPLFVRAGTPLPMRAFTARPTSAPLTTLVVRCYPGDAGTSSLYEDDGQAQQYRSGAAATTELSYARDGDTMTLIVGATKGHFDGQLAQRGYTFELPCVEKPTRVSVDGVDQPVAYDEATSTARIEVTPRAIDRPTTLVVVAEEADAEATRRRAVATRLAGVVGRPVEGKSTDEMLRAAIDATPDPTLRTAALAAAGIAVIRANDSPYLFGGHESFRVDDSSGLIDATSTTASLVSAALPDRETPAVPVASIDDATLKRLAAALPAEDAVVVPGNRPTLRVRYTVRGRACEQTFAASQIDLPTDLDLARGAAVTVTSTEPNYEASGLNDGIANGYPAAQQNEWSSHGERVGAAATLTWPTDQTIGRVALYDKPNLTDHVFAGKLVFSDGNSVPFGELPNDGNRPVVVPFEPKTVRWLRLEITSVSSDTKNAGLAEVAAYR